MRPVNKDNPPKDEITFKEYQHARRYLIDTIGEYCCYCERKIVANLAVEHIEPKSILKNKHLELKWSNFLLGCTNCNSTKSDKDIVLGDYFWADSDNTYSIFSYDESGCVKVSSQITGVQEIQKAMNTIKLVGLDKEPPNEGTVEWKEASDRRFEQRIQAFENAKDYADKYAVASQEVKLAYLDCFKTIVINQGFWSIWMRAFENFPEVQKELINAFAGTRKEFFQNILNAN
ncbi:hypothetical protein DOJK_01219 [Patescibacteria group bacterium]|nr:hypothetical protein DOJK_01219 [Patescibacteria group bacterium]